jgi:hypothetical protein
MIDIAARAELQNQRWNGTPFIDCRRPYPNIATTAGTLPAAARTSTATPVVAARVASA